MSNGDINSNTNTGFKAGTMIKSNKLAFDYILANTEDGTEQSTHALEDINICIKQGEFIAVLGHNGSGKSTLAKHLNALLVPTSGTLWVNGFDTANEAFVWDIRNSTGMVFQNPDNQIVAYIVEEDIAFGPENLGVPPDEIRERVDSALKAVGMLDYASHSAHKLSGGQKQRISIAGVLAMRPECIVFDEPTAMLDPLGRKEVMNTIKKLNAEGITVILITHYMDEAVMAGRVIVMSDGRIVMTGTPGQIFVQTERLAELGLDVPQVTQVAAKLISRGINIRRDILTVDEMVDELKCLLKSKM